MDDTPFRKLGGEEAVRALVERFYDAMERDAPALTKLHERDVDGRVSRAARDRLALFFIGWFGGPQTYSERHGHPALRWRHRMLHIDAPLRDAWMRAMVTALDGMTIEPELRTMLETKLAQVAEMLRVSSPPA
jgi:hemoglobin